MGETKMPGTSIKDGLAKWKAKNEQDPAEAEVIDLSFQMPPCDKMDTALLVLVNCKKLNLCTNSIDKIANLNGLKNLVILNLARNNIKKFNWIGCGRRHSRTTLDIIQCS